MATAADLTVKPAEIDPIPGLESGSREEDIEGPGFRIIRENKPAA